MKNKPRTVVTIALAVLTLCLIAGTASAQTATVSAEDASIEDVGGTATSTISVDASSGISGIDVNVSIEDTNAKILKVEPVNPSAEVEQNTTAYANLSYTDIGASNSQIDLATVTFEMTKDVRDEVGVNLTVPFAQDANRQSFQVNKQPGTLSLGGTQATVTAKDAAIGSVGGTATSTVTIDANKAVAGANVTLSINTNAAEISSASPSDGTVESQGNESVDFGYQDSSPSETSLELGTVTFEMTQDTTETVPIVVESTGVSTTEDGQTVPFDAVEQNDGTLSLTGQSSKETATVSTENVNLKQVGDTSKTPISIDASDGVGGADVTLSIDSPNVEISDATVADQPGQSQTDIEDQTADSVNISYTDIGASTKQLDLADVQFEATGEIQSRVDMNLDVTFIRVGGTNEVGVTTDPGSVIGGTPVGNATVNPGQASLPGEGETGEATITVDAEKGLSAADVTVSVGTSVATITDIQPGSDVNNGSSNVDFNSNVDSTGGSATISYTEVGAPSDQLEDFKLAVVEMESQRDDGQTTLSVGSDGLFAPGGGFYSVRTNSTTVTAGGAFSKPLLNFDNLPQNTRELDPTLYEDLDGDGNGTEVSPAVTVFGELIRGGNLGLTAGQADKLDWDRDDGDGVDIDDIVALFGEKIRAP
jgi:hypothetical protein